jgi:hypothetical protein
MAKTVKIGWLPWLLCGLLSVNHAFAVDVAAAPAARAALPQGSVWECVLNGQRTFSDAPCGVRPVIRQLNPLNRMDSSAAVAYDSYDSDSVVDASDQSPADSADGYVSSDAYWIHERSLRAHPPAHGNRGRERERSRKH